MTPAALDHLGWGLIATGLAALRIFAWSATGLLLGTRRLRAGPAIRVSVALMAGACLTMLVYATLASMGMLATAIALDAAIAALSLWKRGADARRDLYAAVRMLLPSSRTGRIALAAALCAVWVVAIGPPRDGDVMHYHLAHIRQIIAHGVWRQLPVCSYGIPFGWSLTYLPFEWAGIPQTAHLLNAGAWLLTCALCVESVRPMAGAHDGQPRAVMRWMLSGATPLPAIMKAATTAMADSFTILVVALVVALLMAWPQLGRGGAAALGFAAFCGLTTRYQAAAIVIAATVVVGIEGIRKPGERKLFVPFASGGLAASIAAAPFYIANAATLGSPVWPFASSLFGAGRQVSAGGTAEAAKHVAALCASSSVAGGFGTVGAAAWHLLVDRSVFPIPAVLALGCLLGLTLNAGGTRRVGLFILVFMCTWAAAQPTLAPRFSIYLTGAAIVCVATPLSLLLATRAAPAVRIAGGVALGVLMIAAGVYAREYFQLATSGDVPRFHRATWYWPAFDWANRETPRDARFVVALYGGNTYPLDRWNISADPGSSATLPWSSVADGCGLDKFLLRIRADFVFYGPNVWTGQPMHPDIQRTVDESVRSGLLDTVRTFAVPIVYSRMQGLERRSTVTLYRVDRSAISVACSQKGNSLRNR